MISADTFRKIRSIELRTRKLVNDSLAGAYRSAFKGRGIEFDTIRPYEPGDDVRLIDWSVTARTGFVFVKQYIEERELTVMLVMDTSASFLFGSGEQKKRDLAAEIGSVLAYSAIFNNDKVGLLLFSTRNELYVPPQKGRNHVLRLIRDLLSAQPSAAGTDIAAALQMASRSLKRRSIIFLLSDFLAPVESYATELSLLSHHHDVIALIVNDVLESSWPDLGLVNVTDAETGHRIWVDTQMPHWQQSFSTRGSKLKGYIDDAMVRSKVDFLRLNTNSDYVTQLTALFQRRISSRQ